MKVNKWLVVLMGISVVFTGLIYPSLPKIIPTHWGISGEIDSTGPKIYAMGTALLPAVLYGLMVVVPKIDPKKQSYLKFEKAYNRFVFAVVLLLIGTHWVTMAWALGYELPVDMAMKVGVGALIIILGNSLGQIRPNYTMGIKTPWTLASESVWIKTHRVSSYYFVGCGILMIVSVFIKGTFGFILSIGSLVIVTFGSIAYSYILFIREEKEQKIK
ncbi:MAG: SdpI family protein [Turicibacter sp.]